MPPFSAVASASVMLTIELSLEVYVKVPDIVEPSLSFAWAEKVNKSARVLFKFVKLDTTGSFLPVTEKDIETSGAAL